MKPWLAPDGQPWLASRSYASGRRTPLTSAHKDGLFLMARRTPVAVAARMVLLWSQFR